MHQSHQTGKGAEDGPLKKWKGTKIWNISVKVYEGGCTYGEDKLRTLKVEDKKRQENKKNIKLPERS